MPENPNKQLHPEPAWLRVPPFMHKGVSQLRPVKRTGQKQNATGLIELALIKVPPFMQELSGGDEVVTGGGVVVPTEKLSSFCIVQQFSLFYIYPSTTICKSRQLTYK